MSDITIELVQATPIDVNIVSSAITISFDCFDADSWIEGLPEYANNDAAYAAIGAGRAYVASAMSDIAARGTVLRTYMP